jgi:hypothetical protein
MLENGLIDAGRLSRFKLRSKRPILRLKRLDRLDGRTRSARYARELMTSWEKALTANGGKLTDVQRRNIRYAACCVVLSEHATARLMEGDESVPLGEVTKLQNSAARAVARLGLPSQSEPERADGDWPGLRVMG